MMMLKIPFLKLFRVFFFFLSFLFLATSFVSCGDEKKTPAPTSNKIVIKQAFKDKVAAKSSDEYMLLENACLYCHTIGTSTTEVVAPTMQEVRDVYKHTYPTKEAFVQSFLDFCENPVAEKSLMPSAIDQYGLMEDAGHTKEDIEDIAAYLFDYQF